MTYTVLPEYKVDSPEWHEARRSTLGASEVAAVLGLSPWQTPYSVYKAKMGVRNEIPEDVAYFGRALEEPIAQWIRDKQPHVGRLVSGFSAVNPDYPWLSASPDRFADNAGILIPVELKTSSAFNEAAWKSGVPLYYQAQVQTQMLVFGTDHAWLAVLHGGNKPALYPVQRDDDFLAQMIRQTRKFWTNHVEAQVPPDPSTIAEVYEVYPSDPGTTITGSEEVIDAYMRRSVLLSDARSMTEEADALTLAIGQYMGTAETLLDEDGSPIATFKSQPGRRHVTDLDELERLHPEFVARGNDFKVLRAVKRKALANV